MTDIDKLRSAQLYITKEIKRICRIWAGSRRAFRKSVTRQCDCRVRLFLVEREMGLSRYLFDTVFLIKRFHFNQKGTAITACYRFVWALHRESCGQAPENRRTMAEKYADCLLHG